MNAISQASQLEPRGRKVCVAIGVFDGVHLGHQQVIRQTISDALQHEGISLVITFDRHPNTIVAPERIPPLIYTLPHKLRVIDSLGVDTTLLIAFDRAFSRQTGEEFIRNLAKDLGAIYSICVGATFAFGYKRSGNVDLLRRLGQELNFTVHGMAAVSLDNQIVSSTRIREAIQKGDLDAASQMIGRAYSLSGAVIKGDQRGHQIGFPTANLDTTGLVLPPTGVYAAHARVGNQTHRAVINIGYRPTIAQNLQRPQVEAHLLDIPGDLYGKELEIIFVRKLREEQKFASIQELHAQIQQDILQAQRWF